MPSSYIVASYETTGNRVYKYGKKSQVIRDLQEIILSAWTYLCESIFLASTYWAITSDANSQIESPLVLSTTSSKQHCSFFFQSMGNYKSLFATLDEYSLEQCSRSQLMI